MIFPLVIEAGGDNRSGEFEATSNVFELDADQLTALTERNYYVNVHTDDYPAGEIRGQLLPESDAFFRVNLAGTNENPSVLSMANGSVMIELDGSALTLSGSFQDLGSDISAGAHIHLGIAGRNGGVVFPLVIDVGDDNRSGIFVASDNMFELDADQMVALMERRFYVNVHSQEHMGGEIRGQIIPQVTTSMIANMSGSAEESSVNSEGSGSIVAELNENMLTITGSFQNISSNYTASHLHVALAGRSGGVTIPLEVLARSVIRAGKRYRHKDGGSVLWCGRVEIWVEGLDFVEDHCTACYNVHIMPIGQVREKILKAGFF